jgi:hypothetical protein
LAESVDLHRDAAADTPQHINQCSETEQGHLYGCRCGVMPPGPMACELSWKARHGV